MTNATEFIINVTGNYPAIALLMKYIAMVGGVFGVLTMLVLWARMEVFQTAQNDQVSYTAIIVIGIFSAFLLSFGWTMNMIGNSFFDFGGSILPIYEGTEEWRVEEGESEIQALKLFAVFTSRIFGTILGLWGLLGGLVSQMPGRDSALLSSGWRIAVGAAFFDPVQFLDLFGGLGTRYLT